MDPLEFFASDHYRRHNSRRLEHLAARFADRRPPGPRIGRQISATHTGYFVDRGCEVTRVEGRGENLAVLRARFPSLATILFDLEDDPIPDLGGFDRARMSPMGLWVDFRSRHGLA
jgi:hypothetical protein